MVFEHDPYDVLESEKTTEKYLRTQVLLLHGLCYKWKSKNEAGVPDRICLFKTALVAFVELKSEGKKPTKLQALVHRALRALGFRVYVIDTKAKVVSFIQEIKTLIAERSHGTGK